MQTHLFGGTNGIKGARVELRPRFRPRLRVTQIEKKSEHSTANRLAGDKSVVSDGRFDKGSEIGATTKVMAAITVD